MPTSLWLTIIAYAFSAIFSFSLAFIALSFNSRQWLNLSFACFTISLGIWSISANLLRVSMWYGIDRLELLYFPAIPFSLAGPALLAFTVRYLGLSTRWADRLSIAGMLLVLFSIPPLFQGHLFSDPSFNHANGILHFEISPIGMVIGTIPVLFTGGAGWLFWQHRHQNKEPLLGLSVFILFLGMLLEVGLGQTIPITPIATGLSSLALGYGVTRQQLFNPLRERTEELRHEIHERKRVEGALRESEEKYRQIIEASPVGIHSYELQQPGDRLVFTGANPAADWILGVQNQQFIGKTIEEAFPSLAGTELPERYRRACTEGESWFSEQVEYADEKIRGAFEVHAFPYSPGKMTVMFMDITERIQAEQALKHSRESEKLYAERLAHLLSVVNKLSTTDSVTSLTLQAVELGRDLLQMDQVCVWLAAPDYLTMNCTCSIDLTSQQSSEHSAMMSIESSPILKEIFSATAPHLNADGGLLNELQKPLGLESPAAVASMWDGQKVVGLVSMNSQLSQRPVMQRDNELLELYATSLGHLYSLKKAQEDIRKLSEELEMRVAQRTAELQVKNRELETFTYSVSHDLKAPLRGIEGYSRLLEEDYAMQLGEEGIAYTRNIHQGILRMTQLINDLLDYSLLERRKIVKSTVHLPALVDAILASYREEISQRQVQVVMNLTNSMVIAEAEGLAQAIRNLIDNALKFTHDIPDARIEIGSRAHEGGCLFWVQDNGIGFDMKYHERIFEIFQRLHLPEKYSGTGIGLALARKGVERSGGRVWAESTPGKGAIFYVLIPQ